MEKIWLLEHAYKQKVVGKKGEACNGYQGIQNIFMPR
jgi:hypothetical protein